MLNKLKSFGNIGVLLASLVVFVLAFVALNAFAEARVPEQIKILAASGNIAVGDQITLNNLVEKTVYLDENATLYISAEEAQSVLGGYAAQPFRSGQPIFRDSIVSSAAYGYRLSAVLAEYPDHSLFPVPLDENNVVAPGVNAFMPGDLVGITVVIDRRPSPPATPEADPFANFAGYTLPQVYSDTVEIPSPEVIESEQETADALDRSGPPLAKDIFPAGVRVVMVEGKIEPVQSDSEDAVSASVISSANTRKTLILLVPNAVREELALALQQGAQIYVTLLAHVENDENTPGFTYWDFEDQFLNDREHALGGQGIVPKSEVQPEEQSSH